MSHHRRPHPPLPPPPTQDFVELWAQYDEGRHAIDPRDLEALLRRLPPPMGLGPRATDSDCMRFVYSCVRVGCGWGGVRWGVVGHARASAGMLPRNRTPPVTAPPSQACSLDIPLDDNGLVPFHRTTYELVVRCTAADIPAGELKRRLDRMVRRFLTRHTPAPQEHFNFQASWDFFLGCGPRGAVSEAWIAAHLLSTLDVPLPIWCNIIWSPTRPRFTPRPASPRQVAVTVTRIQVLWCDD